jgi:hypothetical protein
VALDSVLRECNKKEFHHLYPRKFLLEAGVDQKSINSLVNFAIIGRAENNKLGGWPTIQISNEDACQRGGLAINPRPVTLSKVAVRR